MNYFDSVFGVYFKIKYRKIELNFDINDRKIEHPPLIGKKKNSLNFYKKIK